MKGKSNAASTIDIMKKETQVAEFLAQSLDKKCLQVKARTNHLALTRRL